MTPSEALIKDVCRTAKAINPQIEIHILVLNKASGFCLDATDIFTLKRSIETAVTCGVDGVVCGALTAGDELDSAALKILIAAAGGVQKTFHRAFDRIADQAATLEQLIKLGFTRLLTSGGQGNAADNIPALKKLVDQAGTRMCIVAGGGIREENLDALARQTNAPVLHMSCRASLPNEQNFKPTDPRIVRRVIDLCHAL